MALRNGTRAGAGAAGRKTNNENKNEYNMRNDNLKHKLMSIRYNKKRTKNAKY